MVVEPEPSSRQADPPQPSFGGSGPDTPALPPLMHCPGPPDDPRVREAPTPRGMRKKRST